MVIHGTYGPIQNHGEPAVLLCFIFLFLAAAGGGPFGLDALLRRRAARRPFRQTKAVQRAG